MNASHVSLSAQLGKQESRLHYWVARVLMLPFKEGTVKKGTMTGQHGLSNTAEAIRKVFQ